MKHPNVRCDIGPLGSKPAKHYTPERTDFTGYTPRVTNATVDPHREPLSSSIWTAKSALRPGSQDAFSLRSHGAGC